jgi:hypothetical protein
MAQPAIDGEEISPSDRIALRQTLMHMNNRHKRGHVCDNDCTHENHASTPRTQSNTPSGVSHDHTHTHDDSKTVTYQRGRRAASESRFYTFKPKKTNNNQTKKNTNTLPDTGIASDDEDTPVSSHRLELVRAGLANFLQIGRSRSKYSGSSPCHSPVSGRAGVGASLRDQLPLQATRRDLPSGGAGAGAGGVGGVGGRSEPAFEIGPDSRHRASQPQQLNPYHTSSAVSGSHTHPDAGTGASTSVSSSPTHAHRRDHIGVLQHVDRDAPTVARLKDDVRNALLAPNNCLFGAPGKFFLQSQFFFEFSTKSH